MRGAILQGYGADVGHQMTAATVVDIDGVYYLYVTHANSSSGNIEKVRKWCIHFGLFMYCCLCLQYQLLVDSLAVRKLHVYGDLPPMLLITSGLGYVYAASSVEVNNYTT